MARRTSTIIWSLLLGFLALVGLLAAVVGPRLYRELRAVAGPIAGLSKSAKAIEALNRDFPFVVPADGVVSEERLLVFLEVYDELRPRYEQWKRLVDEKPHPQGQSWDEAKAALGATSDLQRAQVEILRSHRMSPAELAWIDNAVLSSWWKKIGPALSSSSRSAVAEELRRTSSADLRFVAELESRHGPSAATQALRQRLERRLRASESALGPEVPGIPAANQELFWRHRERIASLEELSDYPLHAMLTGGGHRSRGSRHGRPDPKASGSSDGSQGSSESGLRAR